MSDETGKLLEETWKKGSSGAQADYARRRIVIDPITRLEGHGKIDIFLDDGSTKEEWKMAVETQKILDAGVEVAGHPYSVFHCTPDRHTSGTLDVTYVSLVRQLA